MNEADPENLICGITIDITPLYSNADAKKRSRSQLWEGDEINDKLRKVLERGGIESMTRLIKQRFHSPSYLRVCAEATADESPEDADDYEVFSLDIDIFGDPSLLDTLSGIVWDFTLAELICDDLRPLLACYATETVPDAKMEWEFEPTEYGE